MKIKEEASKFESDSLGREYTVARASGFTVPVLEENSIEAITANIEIMRNFFIRSPSFEFDFSRLNYNDGSLRNT